MIKWFVAYPIFSLLDCLTEQEATVPFEEVMWLIESHSAISAYEQSISAATHVAQFGQALRNQGWSALQQIRVPQEIIDELVTKDVQPVNTSPGYTFLGLRDLVMIESKKIKHGTEIDFAPTPFWAVSTEVISQPADDLGTIPNFYLATQLYANIPSEDSRMCSGYERTILLRTLSEREAYNLAMITGRSFQRPPMVGEFIGLTSLELVSGQIGDGTEFRSRYSEVSCSNLPRLVKARHECRAFSTPSTKQKS